MNLTTPPKTIAFRALLGVSLIALGAFGWTSLKLFRSWQDVERMPFDPSQGRIVLEESTPEAGDDVEPGGEPPPITIAPAAPVDDDVYDAFLVVGNETQLGGSRADVILLILLPKNGADPAIVSLPRDLYIENPCTEKFSRINANLVGCRGGGVPGPDLLAIAVENFTGIKIDHFAIFTFRGFERVIDRVGGITICVERPLRDTNVGLADWRLPAGCTQADGATALGWVRSRHTIHQVDGVWRSVPGVSDLARNQRQQEVILQMLAKARGFSSVGKLLSTIESLADAFVIDDELSIREAAQLAWEARTINPDAIHRLEIPVKNHTTESGAAVLLPTAPFSEILGAAYPDLVVSAADEPVD